MGTHCMDPVDGRPDASTERRIDRDEYCCRCFDADKETQKYARHGGDWLCEDCSREMDINNIDELVEAADEWAVRGQWAVRTKQMAQARIAAACLSLDLAAVGPKTYTPAEVKEMLRNVGRALCGRS